MSGCKRTWRPYRTVSLTPRGVSLSVVAACALGFVVAAAGTARAQVLDFDVTDPAPMARFGPTDPVHGYPMWLEDANGLVLEMCFDTTDVTPPLVIDPETGAVLPPCPACVDPLLDLPNPNLPQSFPDNFPDEHFYELAESIMIEFDNTRSVLTTALEGAFDGLGNVVDGEQIVFVRYRVRVDNATPGQLYQITYPFGVTYAEAEADQAGAAISNINFTNDIFLWKGVPLRDPLSSIQSVFMTSVNPPPAAGAPAPVDPATGAPIGPVNTQTYLGDFCGGGPATGSPFGTNFFSVVGPDAGIVQSTVNSTRVPSFFQCDPTMPAMVAAFDAYDVYVQTNIDATFPGLARIADNCTISEDLTILAKPATKLGVQVDRATYTRDLTLGSNSTQINVWASSFENQDIRLTIPGIVGDIPMCGDGTGHYFSHVLMPSSFIPPIDPATVDPAVPGSGHPTVTVTNFTDTPPRSSTHALNANIQIQKATVDLGANTLAITASVTDPAQSGASLSTGGVGLAVDPAAPTVGTATIALGAGACGAVPPASVTVSSSQGGTATAPTTIVGAIPPVLAAAGGTIVVPTGSLATLDGTASIGLGLTYSWVQSGSLTGFDATLDPLWDPTAVQPQFTFPAT
ncbi:MAG: hypothetical protein ACE5E6_10600, partial [Phycisphaerae bacterium]